jgi:hypothetical protein
VSCTVVHRLTGPARIAAAATTALVLAGALAPPARPESAPPGVRELWQEYPLEQRPAGGAGPAKGRAGAAASGEKSATPRAGREASAPAAARPDSPIRSAVAHEALEVSTGRGGSGSASWAIALVAGAALVLTTATSASRFLARRRVPVAPGAAAPDTTESCVPGRTPLPEHCTIRLERARRGSRFVARIEPLGRRPLTVARSRPFPGRNPERLRENERAVRAHVEILFLLHNDRWLPVDPGTLLYRQSQLGAGRHWFERRFSRSADHGRSADR